MATLAQNHGLHTRLAHAALAQLAAHAGKNWRIVDAVKEPLAQLPMGDSRAIYLLRATSFFLDTTDKQSFNLAKQRLLDIALRHAPTPADADADADADEVDRKRAWGTEVERYEALVHTLPRWLSLVPDERRSALITHLSGTLRQRQDRIQELDNMSLGYVRARDAADTPRLPGGTKWLSSSSAKFELPCAVRAWLRDGNDNRLLISQVIDLASDLSALKGDRHRFVTFIVELIESTFDRLRSSDLAALLEALVNQLGDPEFDGRRTQHEAFKAVGRFVPYLDPAGRERVAAALMLMIEHLERSRLSGVHDLQGSAVVALDSAMAKLHAELCAPLLMKVLDMCDRWSTLRRPKGMARTRKDFENYAVASVVSGGLVVIAPIATVMVGSKSVHDRGLKIVSDALKRLLPLGAPPDDAQVMVPVCRRIVDDPKWPPTLRQTALTILVRGGLPFNLSALELGRFVTLALSDTDETNRGTMARTLMQTCKRAGPHNTTRMAAARCLHHMLTTGEHGLDDADIENANDAVEAAFTKTRVFGRNDSPSSFLVMTAMLKEVQGTPLEKLVPSLAARVVSQFDSLPPTDMVTAMPNLVLIYAFLGIADQQRLREKILAAMPLPPAATGEAGAERQRIGLTIVKSLSNCRVADPTPMVELAHAVLPRMRGDMQSAAMEQMLDGFDSALEEGQQTILAFIAGLQDNDRFVGAAAQLVERVLGDSGVLGALSAPIRDAALATVLDRLEHLSNGQLSDLVTTAIKHAGDLPVPLLKGFIGAAQRLDTPALRSLLVAFGNGLLAFDLADPTALTLDWARAIKPRAAMSQHNRDVVRAFMAVAANWPGGDKITPAAAAELVAALPQMNAQMQQAALPYIEQMPLPHAQRTAIVDDVLRHPGKVTEQARQAALRMGLAADPARTLHALASRVGMPEIRNNQPHRPELSDAVLDDSLLTMLQQGDPEVVTPALEAMADNYRRVPPKYRQAIVDLTTERWDHLAQEQRTRVAETLLLHIPDLSNAALPPTLTAAPDGRDSKLVADDHAERMRRRTLSLRVNEQFPGWTAPADAATRLHELRESRLSKRRTPSDDAL